MVEVEAGVARPHRDDPVARGQQVGLDDVVSGAGSTGRVARNLVAERIVGVPVGDRADRDDLAGVARAGDRAVAILAGVPGRSNDNDPGVPEGLDRHHQRVIDHGFGDRLAERHVDHPDAIGVLVQQNPVEAGYDVGDEAFAFIVQYLDGDDRCPGCDARVLPVGSRAVPGDDACDVRPMTVAVVGIDRVDHVDRGQNRNLGMSDVAGIEHRHGYSGAVDAGECVTGNRPRGHLAGDVHGSGDRCIDRHDLEIGVACESLGGPGRDPNGVAGNR